MTLPDQERKGAPPIKFHWDGEVMIPASRYWASQCDQHFVVGQTYRMVEEQERSSQSHRHEFAFIKEAWNSFPDHLLRDYPSPEHLRKHGLIRKGFCTMKQYACPTRAEAERLMATLKDNVDTYALVVLDEDRPVVSVLTAESQSYRAMKKMRFQESKQALMEFIGDLIGVDPATLANVQEAA